MIEYPVDVAFKSASELTISAGVSPSVLVRLAQSVGFQDFIGLRTLFERRLLPTDPGKTELDVEA